MFGAVTSDDDQPVTWVGQYPVHVTTLLVAVHVALTIAACFLAAFGGGALLSVLTFDSAQVISLGRIWQILTYAFVHVPYSAGALFWFAIEMLLLFWFGREVERSLGRKPFMALYALLLLVPPLFLTISGLWTRLGIAGSAELHFGIFIAFAAMYPGVEMFMFRIPVKWLALGLVAIGTLAAMASHDWARMIVLLATTATAFLFVQMRGAGPELGWLTNLRERLQPKPKFKVVPRPSSRRVVEPEDVYVSIDPLLEKISKSGINSLTASERRALDRARNQLLKKSR